MNFPPFSKIMMISLDQESQLTTMFKGEKFFPNKSQFFGNTNSKIPLFNGAVNGLYVEMIF